MGKINVVADSSLPTITITREFDAPRDLVFKAFTDPALVPQWWGPHGTTTVVDKMDVQFGGAWRYVQHSDEGEYAFRGVYHEIVAPERLVNTYEFEGMPGHIGLITTMFTENNGKTTITEVSLFPSFEDRAGMLDSGMEEGSAMSYDRFEELLKTL